MSVSGICQVCESREADRSCPTCGRVVCDVDFEEEAGVCAICAGEAGGEGPPDAGGPGASGGEDDLGPGPNTQT